MAEKSSTGRSKRGAQLIRQLPGIETWRGVLLAELTPGRALIGLLMILAVTLLLQNYRFREVPDFQIGDIADRSIEAPQDFIVRDVEATAAKRRESLLSVPAVFDFDVRRNHRIEAEIRSGFEVGRTQLAERRKQLELEPDAVLPPAERADFLTSLRMAIPLFDRGDIIEPVLANGFSRELEEEMVSLLKRAMRHPGVTASRDLLLVYQDRGIILVNTETGQDEPLQDWIAVRDLSQAREQLRQNQFEVTAVTGEAKRRILRFLEERIVPNVQFNDGETQAREQLAMNEVPPVLIQIRRGRTILRAGDEVTPQKLTVLQELQNLKQAGQPVGQFIGAFLLVFFFMFALWQYFLVHRQRYPKPARFFLMSSLVLLLHLLVSRLLIALCDLLAGVLTLEYLQDPIHYHFVVPVALGAVLMILLTEAQLGILYSLAYASFLGLMVGRVEMAIFALIGSLAALYGLRQYRERSAIVRVGLGVGLVNVGSSLALLLYGAGFTWESFSLRAGSGFLGGLFTAMLASLLLPILEWLFEITTDIRLVELSNLNKPILRRLAVEAPGTYHHSIIVGTLAESAAEAIGANALLVRVGAYYHDIGKLRKPEYYVENQIYMANKHEGLSPSMSSLILASHVKDGLALAEEINLTPKVRDLIPEHHGTKLMAFFYQKALQNAEEKGAEVNEQEFRYPGPKPQTREAAILMLADQVEAASRTLQDPSPRQIRGLIRRLIQTTIEDRQFDECDITTRDLDLITRAFERVITGMYHHRVEYPGFDFNKQVEDSATTNQRIQ